MRSTGSSSYSLYLFINTQNKTIWLKKIPIFKNKSQLSIWNIINYIPSQIFSSVLSKIIFFLSFYQQILDYLKIYTLLNKNFHFLRRFFSLKLQEIEMEVANLWNLLSCNNKAPFGIMAIKKHSIKTCVVNSYTDLRYFFQVLTPFFFIFTTVDMCFVLSGFISIVRSF